MNNNNQIKNIGNTIEIHYCFNDATHSMDALQTFNFITNLKKYQKYYQVL